MASLRTVSTGSACSAMRGGKHDIGWTRPCRSTTSARCSALSRTDGSGSVHSSTTNDQYRCATPFAKLLSCSPLIVWKLSPFFPAASLASARLASACLRRFARDNAPPAPAMAAAVAREPPPAAPACALASSDIWISVRISSSRRYSSRFRSACSFRLRSADDPSAARMIPSMEPLPKPPLGQSMSCGRATKRNPHACSAPRLRSNSVGLARCRKHRNSRSRFPGDTASSRDASSVSAPNRARCPSTKSARETCARSLAESSSRSDTSSRSLTNRRQICSAPDATRASPPAAVSATEQMHRLA